MFLRTELVVAMGALAALAAIAEKIGSQAAPGGALGSDPLTSVAFAGTAGIAFLALLGLAYHATKA